MSAAEAALRLGSYGPNELQALDRTSPWHTLAAQFKNVLILILLAATLLSLPLGHALEADVIAVIVLFAVLLGFVQEYRAERALQALWKMAAPLGRAVSRDTAGGQRALSQADDRAVGDSTENFGAGGEFSAGCGI